MSIEKNMRYTRWENYQRELDERFGSDFRSRYVFHKCILEKGGENLHNILMDLGATLQSIASASEFMTTEHIDSFLNEYLPDIINLLLNKKLGYFALMDQSVALTAFLCVFLLYRTNSLSPQYPGDFKTLVRVLNGQKKLYSGQMFDEYDVPNKIIGELSKYYGIEYTPSEKIKHHYQDNYFPFVANFFLCYLSGGNSLLEIINEQKEGISFQMLHQMLKSTYYLRPHYKGDWNQFADKMGNGALNFAYNMNEEALRTLLEKHLTAAKRNIENLFQGVILKSADLRERTEIFELRMAFSLLTSTILDKRIIGINILVSIVRAVLEDQKGTGLFAKNYLWLDIEKLSGFLVQTKVFDIIFGEHIHQVIVRKSKQLIIFLYEKGNLSYSKIIAMWEKASSKHEATKRAILHVLEGVIPKFSTTEAVEVFEKIKKIPPGEITEETLSILKLLSENEIERYLGILKEHKKKQTKLSIGTKLNVQGEPKIHDSSELIDLMEGDMKHKIEDDYKEGAEGVKCSSNIPPLDISKVQSTISLKERKIPEIPKSTILNFFDMGDATPNPNANANANSSQPPTKNEYTAEPRTKESIKYPLIPHLPQLPANLLHGLITNPQVVQDDSETQKAKIQPRRSSYDLHPNTQLIRTDFKQELLHQQIINNHEPLLAKNYQFLFFQYFWDLLMDKSLINGMKLGVFRVGFSMFLAIIHTLTSSKKILLLEKALDNMKNNDSFYTSSNILNTFIKRSNFQRTQVTNTKEEIAKKLDERYEIIPLVLRSLLEFKKSAITQALQLTGEEQIETLDTKSSEEEMDMTTSVPMAASPGPNTEQNIISADNTTEDLSISTILPPQNPQIDIPSNKENEEQIMKDEHNKATESGQMRENKQKSGILSKQVDVMEGLYTNETLHLTFIVELKHRLDYITYLLRDCNLKLNLQHLQMLWECIAVNALFDQEKDLFFDWLNGFLKLGQVFYYHDQTIPKLFFQSILKVDFKFISTIHYIAFQTFFLQINMTYGQIEPRGRSSLIEVHSDKLIAFSHLWEIVLQTREDSVFKLGSKFLHKIYRGMRVEDMRQIKSNFLELCMRHIRQGKGEIDKYMGNRNMGENLTDAKNRMMRSIGILAEYIDVFENLNLASVQGKTKEDAKITLMIKNVIGIGDDKKFELKVSQLITVRQLGEQIGKLLNYDKDKLTLMAKGAYINENPSTTLDTLNLDEVTIFVDKKSPEMQQADSLAIDVPMEIEITTDSINKIEEMVPIEQNIIKLALQKKNGDVSETIIYLLEQETVRELREQINEVEEKEFITEEKEKGEKLSEILANKREYFNTLFEILNLGIVDMSNCTWELLSKLPTNSNRLNEIQSLQSVYEGYGWDPILNPHSMYSLLYSLQIINSFMFTASDKQRNVIDEQLDRNFNKSKWRLGFLEFGGYLEIYKILMELDLGETITSPGEFNLRVKCLNYLVSIIKGFIHSAIYSTNTQLDNIITQFTLSTQSNQLLDAQTSSQQVPQRNKTPEFGVKPRNNTPPPEVPETISQPESPPRDKIEENMCKTILEPQILSNLFFRLLDVMKLTFKLGNSNENSKLEDITQLLGSILDLLLSSIISNPELVQQLYTKDIFDYLCTNLLLNSKNHKISKCFEKFLLIISTLENNTEEERTRYLEELLRKIPGLNEKNDYCSNYFSLLCELIQFQNSSVEGAVETTTPPKYLVELFNMTKHIIVNRSPYESEDLVEDVILFGYLSLMHTIVTIFPTFRGEIIVTQSPSSKEPNLNINLVEYLYIQLMNSVEDIDDSYTTKSTQFVSKCTFKATRKKAFDLLILLCTGVEVNYRILLKMICMHHESIEKHLTQLESFDFDVGNKSKVGYVGLKNFGATCYINSLLQQFYMMHDFRNIILAMKTIGEKVHIEENMENNQEGKKTQENVIDNLRTIFAHLKYSEKQYFSPTKFLQEFKGLDGQPINVRVQEDCHEFLNLLWDKIERETKYTENGMRIHELIGGELSQEIISLEKEYPYRSSQPEAALSISVEIKGKRSLVEALDLFVKAERLEGENKYHCEKYNRKVTAMKRCSIKSLRNTVIINLKRFDFNYNTFLREKLNDYCAFPLELNLKPWSTGGIREREEKEENLTEIEKECRDSDPDPDADANRSPPNEDSLEVDMEDNLGDLVDESPPQETTGNNIENIYIEEDSYYMYSLRGVLVHSGTADGGHYYSYIRETDPNSTHFNKWIEFNDSYITNFTIDHLNNECFGGKSKVGYYAYDKSSNAYMLFYHRVKPIPMDLTLTPTVYEEDEINVCESIIRENQLFNRYKQFYDSDYFSFIGNFIHLYNLEPQLSFLPINSENLDIQRLRRVNELTRSGEMRGLPIGVSEIEEMLSKEFRDIIDVDKLFLPPSTHILEMNKIGINLARVKIGTIMAYIILQKTNNCDTFVNMINLLTRIYETQAHACLWLLKHLTIFPVYINSHIFHKNHDVREAFGALMKIAITGVYQSEEVYLMEIEHLYYIKYYRRNPEDPEQDVPPPHVVPRSFRSSALGRFMKIFFEHYITKDAKENYLNFHQYFEVLNHFAHLGFNAANFLITTSKGLTKLYKFTTISDFPRSSHTIIAGTHHSPPVNLRPPIELMIYLITCCNPSPLPQEIGRFSPQAIYKEHSQIIDFPDMTRELLRGPLIGRSLRRNSNLVPQIKDMVTHMCYQNLQNSKLAIYSTFQEYGEQRSNNGYIPYSQILFSILTINDGHMIERLKIAFFDLKFTFFGPLGVQQLAIDCLKYYSNNAIPFTIDGLNLITNLAHFDSASLLFFRNIKMELFWVPRFVNDAIKRKFASSGFFSLPSSLTAKKHEDLVRSAEYILNFFKEKLEIGQGVEVMEKNYGTMGESDDCISREGGFNRNEGDEETKENILFNPMSSCWLYEENMEEDKISYIDKDPMSDDIKPLGESEAGRVEDRENELDSCGNVTTTTNQSYPKPQERYNP